MRCYGTLPLVRETGGLKDTVISYLDDSENGTGFKFENFDDGEFNEAIKTAINIYQNDKDAWNKIIKNAMAIDNNIDKMARNIIIYIKKWLKKTKKEGLNLLFYFITLLFFV